MNRDQSHVRERRNGARLTSPGSKSIDNGYDDDSSCIVDGYEGEYDRSADDAG